MRRLKTYTAENGGVFDYYFVGQRDSLPGDPYSPATEYVFDVATGGCPKLAVSIFLTRSMLSYWQTQHGRELSDPERYAAAKMKLFRVFDQWRLLTRTAQRASVDPEEMAELLLAAGVD